MQIETDAVLIDKMPMIRVFFSKTGRAKYTSHLDTMRTLTRAFKRSGLPLWHTLGFNPHMYMTFALPIALGYESLCESVDIRLTKDMAFADVIKKLNDALPPGFSATSAATPIQDTKDIAWADYDVKLIYTEADVRLAMSKLEVFLKQPTIEVLKKSKKGEKLVDIKPLSEVLSATTEENAIKLKLRMASGITVNINPTLLLKAFYDFAGFEPDGVKILRTAILDTTKQNFR